MSVPPIDAGCGRAQATAPACYDVQLTHHRRAPVDYAFRTRARTWLVDLDAVPRLPRKLGWLVRFDRRGHRSMAARPGYRQYMHRTSGFIPLPPRRR